MRFTVFMDMFKYSDISKYVYPFFKYSATSISLFVNFSKFKVECLLSSDVLNCLLILEKIFAGKY